MNDKIKEIQDRNTRVELDKAWETSRTRRTIVAFLTYLTAAVFLKLIGNNQPFLNALVPFGGYFFSTISLPYVKRWWIKRYGRKV
jgi:hypothetical protein